MRAWGLSVLAGCLLAACSGGDDGSADGGPDSAVADAAIDVTEPDAPADPIDAAADAFVPPQVDRAERPRLTPCPSGWRQLGLGDEARCDPWPASGRVASCPGGEAHFPGAAACAPLGAACPAGDWPVGLPTGRTILYVRGPGTGGSGTLADPYRRIGAAMSAAGPGSIVAVAKGSYAESVRVPAGVTMWGACAGASTVTTPTTDVPSVEVLGLGAEVRNLSLAGPGIGVRVPAGASARLSGLSIVGVRGAGLSLDGNTTASQVLVRAPAPAGSGTGAGVLSGGGAQSTLVFVVVEGANVTGVEVRDAATHVTMIDSAVLDTTSPREGAGLVVEPGATLTLRRVTVERNAAAGVAARGPNARVELEDVVIREPLLDGAGYGGSGLLLALAEGVFSRVLIERAQRGIAAYLCPSLTLTDSVVRDSAAAATGIGVMAIESTLVARRTVITGAHIVGLVASKSPLTLEDVVLNHNRSGGAEVREGYGLMATDSSPVTGTRLEVIGNRLGGITFFAGSSGTLSHVDVGMTMAPDCAQTTCRNYQAGIGITVEDQVALDVRNFRMTGNALAGAIVGADATLDLHDGVISGNPIGANVQRTGFDSARLRDQVFYFDNGVNLDDASALPIPPRPAGF